MSADDQEYAKKLFTADISGKDRPIDWGTCPNQQMATSFKLYYERGLSPGGFGRAFLANDLQAAVSRADSFNRQYLVDMVRWAQMTLPPECWGSHEIVDKWEKMGGVLSGSEYE